MSVPVRIRFTVDVDVYGNASPSTIHQAAYDVACAIEKRFEVDTGMGARCGTVRATIKANDPKGTLK